MIAIIDGDVLAYNACESRYDVPMHGEVKIELDPETGERKVLSFTKEQDRKYLEKCWAKFEEKLQQLLESVYCTNYLMAVKGPDNFRNLMYPEYKMNRHKDPTKTNHFVPILRKLAVVHGYAVEAYGREADDLMRIWAEEARAAGDDFIVCSIDKDLKCIPGKFYRMPIYDWMGNIKSGGTITDITEANATRHYYEQLLKGDPTDNIPGVPRVGEIKAAKILQPYTTIEEFQERVVEEYFAAYGEDDWLGYLLSNGKMIHLQKDANDYFNCADWKIVQELRQ